MTLATTKTNAGVLRFAQNDRPLVVGLIGEQATASANAKTNAGVLRFAQNDTGL
jgi:hypothetical protein